MSNFDEWIGVPCIVKLRGTSTPTLAINPSKYLHCQTLLELQKEAEDKFREDVYKYSGGILSECIVDSIEFTIPDRFITEWERLRNEQYSWL